MARPTEKAQRHRPPKGVPINPPDVAAPGTTLSESCPKLDEIKFNTQDVLSSLVDTVDPRHMERRITLLSRMIIEAGLWESDGMTKKERIDAALRAIATFEGSKSTLWVQETDGKDLPKTQQDYREEKERLEKNILRLAAKHKTLPMLAKAAMTDALKHVDTENALILPQVEE